MTMEYEKPFVEIVDFLALERIATERSQKEARDGGSLDVGDKQPGFGESIFEWPDD